MKLSRFISYLAIAIIGEAAGAGDLSSLQACLNQGYLALPNRRGIVAAAIDAETFQAMTFGSAKLNQIFEIGSVTKTFTANLLAYRVGLA